MPRYSRLIFSFIFFVLASQIVAQTLRRERLLMDRNWRFSFGHTSDHDKDFNYGAAYFSSYAKSGFADGPASSMFDDRAWRKLNIPHDWAVEAPFDSKASLSHGFKAIGRNFPERNIGWYRKTFFIPKSDDGRKITIEFDGVFRNSITWINGHYLGVEPSGYSSFQYDLTDYLNYGGENVIVVRVDAGMEEGWFYEGAGIYRHVWLVKTDPLHVDYNGTFVSTVVAKNLATVKVRTSVVNDGKAKADFTLKHFLVNAQKKKIDSIAVGSTSLAAGASHELTAQLTARSPMLWSLENPYLYKMITTISSGEKLIDTYETTFGMRDIRWDPNQGFFLNGKHVKLQGTNNHQDHAGVGTALPDELQRFRIAKLKEIGCNAYRCSHNPPTPELLKACDELGMLVIDENRLMGSSDQNLKELKRMIVRDRNHPSIILWSLGNEEWSMEGTERGARIVSTMQHYARRLDSTRLYTAAVSGGWGNGISTVLDVMGYNYISHGNTDQQHKIFPLQDGVGTEEGATFSTRGIYADDKEHCHLNAYDWDPTDWGASAEEGWTYYNKRDYLAGMFVWSGFDYRGEPAPFGWPAIASQFGVLDLCGFPKDNSFYYKSWWTTSPMLHLFPHWNSGMPAERKKGEPVKVWVYSNCDEVELFLNGKSQGRQKIQKDSHAEWSVPYIPGKLEAKGYINGKNVSSEIIQTTEKASTIEMKSHKPEIKADGEDLAIITVSELDKAKRFVPDANDEIVFTIQGPGKIIGVGNGDPSSLEADKYIDEITEERVTDWKVKTLNSNDNLTEVMIGTDDTGWTAMSNMKNDNNNATKVFRGKFVLPEKTEHLSVKVLLPSIGNEQGAYLNGKALKLDRTNSSLGNEVTIDAAQWKAGENIITIVADAQRHEELKVLVQITKSATPWKRKLFNGLAQVIVQSTGGTGEIILKAVSGKLNGEMKISVKPSQARVEVE
ncbi:MAG TPA: beta-galactosidase GalA [Cyclobacteriaceae bacterium]|jgi:beta-galactosidase|nr:beta-galactosidase GalA [Cyclobacteriaceae bacterium]